MAVRVFSLSCVPTEEAEGVRNALCEAGVEFYETPPTSLGMRKGDPDIHAAAIWVQDDLAGAARAAIDQFQAEWQRQARAEAVSPVKPRPKPLERLFWLMAWLVGLVLLVQLYRFFFK
ncbi:MAG: DUF6164 family protein [Gammaproteobacteria bacterium]|nr:DUF6164 family protein [Gammaproteobacteria bacterium]